MSWSVEAHVFGSGVFGSAGLVVSGVDWHNTWERGRTMPQAPDRLQITVYYNY
jgi:hypothetical protein